MTSAEREPALALAFAEPPNSLPDILTMSAHMTICPPAAAKHACFDKYQFDPRMRSLTKQFLKLGGIDFADFRSMHLSDGRTKHGVGHERRLDTPAFMLDANRRRAVIIRYLEFRVGLYALQEGTEEERVLRILDVAKREADSLASKLDRWCAEYVAARSAGDEQQEEALHKKITQADAELRVVRNLSLIPQMCALYYDQRLNSTLVGERLSLKDCTVRQIFRRMALLAAEMQAGSVERHTASYFRGKTKGGRHGN